MVPHIQPTITGINKIFSLMILLHWHVALKKYNLAVAHDIKLNIQ